MTDKKKATGYLLGDVCTWRKGPAGDVFCLIGNKMILGSYPKSPLMLEILNVNLKEIYHLFITRLSGPFFIPG